MHIPVFDEIHVQDLDRRQFQLTVLASMTIAVLATGVAVLMYPAIFSQDLLVTGQTVRFAYYGFCCLSVLLVGYLWDRQITIRHLTEQVQIEQRQNSAVRLCATNDLLNTIAGMAAFRERLSAHSRAAAPGSKAVPLSVAVVRLYLSEMPLDKSGERIALGDAAQTLHRRLRAADSIYTLAPATYGIILPGMEPLNAQHFAASLELGLLDAAGMDGRFSADVHLLYSADYGRSEQEFEQAISALLPRSAPRLEI